MQRVVTLTSIPCISVSIDRSVNNASFERPPDVSTILHRMRTFDGNDISG